MSAGMLLSLVILLACPWVDESDRAAAADRDGDGVSSVAFGGTDCDDADAAVGAPALTVYADADGDGLGDAATAALACAAGEGVVTDATDCDDGDASVGAPTMRWPDADGDGHGDATAAGALACTGGAAEAGDCDDVDASVHPGAWESCVGEVDANCDGAVGGDWCSTAGLGPWATATPEGVAYLPLAAEPAEMARLAEALVAQIEASGAEVVYSTLNGTPGNFAFFEALRARRPVESLPSVSFSIGEPEAAALAAAGHRMDGEHVSWTWMEGHGIPAHAALRAELKAAIGRDEPVSDPMFSAIAGVRLWARAASRMESGVDDATALLHAMAGTEVVVGGQSVIVDRENHHVWKPNHIGRFRPDGSLEAVSSMDEPAQAVPFPGFRTEAAWERLTAGLAGPHPG
jgi:hypothetical protein